MNEPAIATNNGSGTNGMEDITMPPAKPPRMNAEKDELPTSIKSYFFERPKKFLAKLRCPKDPDANRTASVQVMMNEQPVDMVIDTGCYETIISQYQWRQLGEPKLGPLTRGDWVIFNRTGKYEKCVAWEEIGGFFYALVKIEENITVLPIYVCKSNKWMPNFLGRRLFYDLRLNTVNAHLIQVTNGNEATSFSHTGRKYSAPEMATATDSTAERVSATEKLENSTAEQESELVETEGSSDEQESANGDDDGCAAEEEPSVFSVTNSSSAADQKPETDKTADLIKILKGLMDKSKEKNQPEREKYVKRMAEAIPELIDVQQAETDELVGLVSSEKTSESQAKLSAKYDNYAKLKKAISKLEMVYKKDHKRADNVLRGATIELNALKKELARTPLNSKWIELIDAVEHKEMALQVVADQEATDFAEKMTTLSDAKGVLPKLTRATKAKNFFQEFKTSFDDLKQKSDIILLMF